MDSEYQISSLPSLNENFGIIFDELDKDHIEGEISGLTNSRKSSKITSNYALMKWEKLQQQLKQEQFLLEAEKSSFVKKMKKMKQLENEYYLNFVDWTNKISNQTPQNSFFPTSEHPKLFHKQEQIVQQFIQQLRSKPSLLLSIIEKNKQSVSSSARSLPSMLAQTFFCPPYRDERINEVLIFLNLNIELEIGSSTDRQNMLRSDSLPKKILKEYLNQYEFTLRLFKIFKDPLQELTKMSGDLKIDSEESSTSTKKIDIKKQNHHSSSRQQGASLAVKMTVNTSQNEDKFDHLEYYSKILKNYDSKHNHNSTTISDEIYFLQKEDFSDSRKQKSSSSNTRSSRRATVLDLSQEKETLKVPLENEKWINNSMEETFSEIRQRNTVSMANSGQNFLSRTSLINTHANNISHTNIIYRNIDSIRASNISFYGSDGNQTIKDLSMAQSCLSSSPPRNSSIIEVSHIQDTSRERQKVSMKEYLNLYSFFPHQALLNKQKKVQKIISSMIDKLFSSVDAIPNKIKIICALIKYQALKKYPDLTKSQLHFSLSFFIVDDWILHILMKTCAQYTQIDFSKQEILQNNTLYIQSILKNIMKKQTFKEGEIQRFNNFINSFGDKVTKFYDELLSCDINSLSTKIIAPSEKKDLVFDLELCTVFLSVENIQRLMQLVIANQSAFEKMGEENVIKLATQLEISKIFGDKYDQPLKMNQIFTLFHFQSDENTKLFDNYFQAQMIANSYNDQESQDVSIHFSKFKQLLISLLVAVKKLSTFAQFSGFNHSSIDLSTILQILSDVKQFEYHFKFIDLYNIQPVCSKFNQPEINVPSVAKYLSSLIQSYLKKQFATNNMQKIYQVMRKEYNNRICKLEKISIEEKTIKMRLRKIIKESIQCIKQEILKEEKKKRKIKVKEFADTFKINICISSPQTRSRLSHAAKNQYSEFDHSSIWVEESINCIHKINNLEFVKDLTGEISPTRKEKTHELHCSNLSHFIEHFTKIPEMEQLLLEGIDHWGINEAYSLVLEKLEDGIKEHPPFQNSSNAERIEITEMLFKSINKVFHRNLFPSKPTYRDAGFYFTLKSLNFLTPENLEISSNIHEEWIFNACSQFFLTMDQKNSPIEKLKCLLDCTKVIAEVLKLSSLKGEAASADLTLPNLIYVLIKSQPKRMISNINFVTAFQCKNKMLSEVGYCFIQVQSAIKFISNLNPSELKHITPLEFHRRLRDEEQNIGISFLKKRKRNGVQFNIDKYISK